MNQEKKPVVHETHLGYTKNDDGVWVFCTCGWAWNGGFGCSPSLANRAAKAHNFIHLEKK